MPNALMNWSKSVKDNRTQLFSLVKFKTLIEMNFYAMQIKMSALQNPMPYGKVQRGTPLCQPGVLIEKKTLVLIGCIKEYLHYTMDIDLWIRLSKVGIMAIFDEVVSANREYAEAKTFRNILQRELETLDDK